MNRKYSGKELAKVLIYYGLVGDINSSDFNIICPFHGDINPSMRVCLSDGTFYCFACEASGDALDFVKLVHPEINDLQCCILLEQILNSDEVKALNVKFKKKKKAQGKQALREAHDYYYGLRVTDWNHIRTKDEQGVLDYMLERGFTRRALNIGQCRVSYNVAYPVLFPILDNGKFRGWVGRTTNKHVERNRMKYLYNDGFRKRDTLCGNYSENSIPFLCEGYLDYLSLRTKGHIKNAVAILGWHIADEQIEKLKKQNIKTVVCALDNPVIDECGGKGLNLLRKHFNVIPFQYPENVKDPGQMSEREIEKAIRRTKELYRHEINSKC